MSAEWVGIVVSGVLLAMGIIGNLVTTVWWASKITTTLTILKSAVDELKADKKTFATKEDLARELAVTDKEHKALWKNVDEIKLVLSNGARRTHRPGGNIDSV